MEILNNIFGKTCFRENGSDLLNNRWCLGRGLDNDCVSGKKGRDKGVDENEIWIL